MAWNVEAQEGKGKPLDLSETTNFGLFAEKMAFIHLPQPPLSCQEDLLHSGEKKAFPLPIRSSSLFSFISGLLSIANNESIGSILGVRISGESIDESFDLIISDTLDRVEVSKRIRPEKRKDIF